MGNQPEDTEHLHKKLDCAVRQIHRNISAFSPEDLEEMVRQRLVDARTVPTELRTKYVRHRLGLRK